MGLKRIERPDECVSLAEVKAQLNITFNDEDAVLAQLIAAATDLYDGPNGDLCGRALMPQTWDLTLDAFPDAGIRIPLPPLIAVESVNYIDPDTQLEVTLLEGTDYEVDLIGNPLEYGWVTPIDSAWPTPFETINAVRVRFVAGFQHDSSPDVIAVPESLRQAIILTVQDMYGQGSAFVDRTQTLNKDTIETLIRHWVIRTV
jgi:uncharacterized phiE125 gp8 family phage protein